MKEKHKITLKAVWTLLTKEPGSLRYLSLYAKSFHDGHQPYIDEYPFITLRALHYLSGYLRPEMSVFEYGAGGSTFFFARRVQKVVSVEHDASFQQMMTQRLAAKNLPQVESHCVPPDPDPVPQAGAEPFVNYKAHPLRKEYTGQNFFTYANFIQRFPDRSFDVVLVDGRARASCAYLALPKLKPGGLLVLDDSHRKEYAEAVTYLKNRCETTDFYGARPHHVRMACYTSTSVYAV